MDTYEVRGQFWLPDTPERKVAGTLTFSPDGGGRLALIGQFLDPLATPGGMPKSFPRVLGLSQMGRSLTLDNCFTKQWNIGTGVDLGEQHLIVGVILDGVEYGSNKTPECNQAWAELRHLYAWTGLNGLAEEYEPSSDCYRLSLERQPPMTVEIEPGVRLTINHNCGIAGPGSARALTQGATVSLNFEAPLSYVDAGRWVTAVQDLVSVATNRTAQIDNFQFFAPDVRTHDGSAERVLVDLYIEWVAREHADGQVLPHDVPVPFDAMGGIEGIANWLRVTKSLRPFITRVMKTRYDRMYADDRFFNCAAALDGLHRGSAPQKIKYYDRLQALATEAGDPFFDLVGDVPKWIRKVVAERDDHAHHLGSAAAQTTGPTRYFLAQTTYWLFVLVLLRRCSFDEPVFDSVKTFRRFQWAGAGVQQIL